MTIQRLSDLEFEAGGGGKPLKICVASFFGAAKSGGVGTATSALIKHLASIGHKVTLLYTLVHKGKPLNVEEHGSGEDSWPYWTKLLAADGISLEIIPHQGHYRDWAQKSWLVKEFLSKHDFDVVYFDDWQGTGYYSLLAKRAGLAPFSTQLHCVITHSTKQWTCASNNEYVDDPSDLEVMALERRSIEMADVVIGPSRYLLREYESYGWDLPEQTFHQFYPFRTPVAATSSSENVAIDELVFFGRLEARKGLWLFCEALDRIADKLKGRIVTFLGPVTYAYGVSAATQIIERSARWPFQIRLLTGLDTGQALEYLKAGNRLAVMPSLADNSPCVIYECIEAAVPFVSTLGSGTAELIDGSCLAEVMVEPNVQALADRLDDILQNGARLARLSFDSEENLDGWSNWHNYIAANKLSLVKPRKNPAARLAAIDVPLFVFVDDGSCALGLLVDNLASHIKRFGKGASYVTLSSRRGDIKDLLSHIFSDRNALPVHFFEPSEVEEARRIILSSQFAFFLDANVEMLTPFFVLALDMLARDPSAVATCVGAVRREDGGASIENLPVGDLPGLSVFGRSIGGPVWALSPAKASEWLSPLQLYDRQIDRYVSAGVLGEIFLHQCRLANVPVELIPLVGAITHQEDPDSPPTSRVNDSRVYCEALGVTPSLVGGGPAWFAISTFGPKLWEELPETDSVVPLTPPLPTVKGRDMSYPSLLAAAFGRPELAFQLEASAGASAERMPVLSRLAVEAARLTPVLDFLGLLDHDAAAEFGPTGLSPARRRPAKVNPAEAGKLDSAALYVDGRLRIEGPKVRTNGSLRAAGPAKIVFLDVALSGQSSLEIKLRSRSSDPLFVRAMAMDQQSGQKIGEKSVRLTRSDPAGLSIDLYKLYGPTTVVVEFSGAEKMEVFFDTLAAT